MRKITIQLPPITRICAVFPAALALLFAGCGPSSGPDSSSAADPELDAVLQDLDEYAAGMDETIRLLEESDDSEAIEAAARALVTQGESIVEAFAEFHPECTEYLDAAKEVIDVMDTIDAETIEADYHLDGALPEGSTECYHAKDLIVHPATVVVLLREGGLSQHREDMINEIRENQSHLLSVRESFRNGGTAE